MGWVTLERAYNHRRAWGQGFCPCDAAPGLAGNGLSAATTRMTGSGSAMVGIGRGSGPLDEPGGLRVRAKQPEDTVEALGREVAARGRYELVGGGGEPP